MERPAKCALALVTAWMLWPLTGATHDTTDVDARIASHLASLRGDFDPRVLSALDRIAGLDRKLLAARSYVRSHDRIGDRWSWSQSQIERYAGSPLQRALDAEVSKVRAVFETENPGYTLWVNPQVRSVELQIERWNENETVGTAAQSLLADLRPAVSGSDAAPAGTERGRDWFAQWLRSATPRPAPPLAAPGLSRHGRMQAVDFQVKQGDRTIAGPSQEHIASVWDAQGWCERLVRAVRLASDRFEGPLVNPNEPWHYEYEPEAGLLARRDE